MRTFLISYGVIEYDGRLAALHSVARRLGDVTMVCCSRIRTSTSSQKIIRVGRYPSIYSYMLFTATAIYTALRIRNIDVLIVDNYFAAMAALVIKHICQVKFVVQDVRELYLPDEVTSWKLRLLVYFESRLMKTADVVLCANAERAEIMQRYYRLSRKPVVFENIRFLSGEYNEEEMKTKYASMFKDKTKIVSTGGISIARGTDRLVRAMKELPDFGLYIVGGGKEDDVRALKALINELQLNNVYLIDKVPLSELRYIVRQCDIGIVHYHRNDLNNKYCASGKVYEYLSEGLPIVTTENPPLVEFCRRSRTGVADDGFLDGNYPG